MKFLAGSLAIALMACRFANAAEPEPRLLTKVTSLPVALNKDFEFRKTKLYFLSEVITSGRGHRASASAAVKSNASNQPYSKAATNQDVSLTFERDYRLFGAVTNLDKRQRYGNYFDFFWRSKRPADVTVRLEYRQEKLHAHVQAQEISYQNVRGTRKTEFKVIGDDYLDDGKVIAWRCLLIENGEIVAENRSFLWD
jgi:hypothetical protein